MKLRTPICDLMDIDVPVFLAGMGGVAFAEVCAAVSEAGGYGTLGMAGCSPEQIRDEMRAVRERTGKPFGVDLLAALPESVEASIDIIISEGASSFIAGLGVPGPVIEKCHRPGVKVISICGKVGHAVAAEEAGCDIVVAQGTEAGGHTGKISAMALVPQVVDAVQIPVLAAGSIVDGRGLVAALAFGAQGIWMGTRFIASEEARAGRLYKDAILATDASGTLVTRCYSGKPMRVLANAYAEEWERHPDDIHPFPAQFVVSFENGVLSVFSGDTESLERDRSCMPAGQGSGAIDAVLPAGEIVRRVVDEAHEVIGRLGVLA
jgi:enoyl-[acyl-carrier protein] reductase II